jgi:hypothetical protein
MNYLLTATCLVAFLSVHQEGGPMMPSASRLDKPAN